MKPDYQLLDCQDEHRYEPVDPDNERVTFWVDEYFETHGDPEPRWRAVAGALLEAILLLGVMVAVVLGVYAVGPVARAIWLLLP